MIGDVIGQSLRQPNRLIPVEALLGKLRWQPNAGRDRGSFNAHHCPEAG